MVMRSWSLIRRISGTASSRPDAAAMTTTDQQRRDPLLGTQLMVDAHEPWSNHSTGILGAWSQPKIHEATCHLPTNQQACKAAASNLL